MLHILLLILKIVGIILAVLLGCIVVSLSLALFVPLHYRVELKRIEAEGSPPIEVNAKLTWLLHFVNVRLLYPSDIYFRVRILFFTLFRLPKKNRSGKEEKDIPDKSKKKEKEKEQTQAAQESVQRESHEEADSVKAESSEPHEEAESAETESSEPHEEAESAETEQNAEAVETEKAAGDKNGGAEAADGTEEQDTGQKLSLKDKINKILNLFKNIWYTIKGICGKIKEILENVEYYLALIQSDTFKEAFSLCKDELGAIFNYIKPRKYQADLIIGAGDPAATGQILSYYGILYPLIGNNVTVVGDFERKRIEGSVFLKGKVKLFTFVKAVIRIYFNKNIRKLLKLFKKEDE